MARTSRRGGKAATAEDVARLARVSPMTVSRVVNGEKNVSATTREAVLAAVRQLSYAPNFAAKSLASAEQPRVGLPFANPSAAYLTEFLIGMLDQLGRAGAQLVLVRCEPGEALSERAAMRQLLEGQVSGVLLTAPLSDSASIRQAIAEAETPAVVVGAGRFYGDISHVRIDDRQAAYDMTRKIVALGHRKLGFISGHPNQTASAARTAGFQAAVRDLAPDARVWMEQGYFTFQSGLGAAERLLSGEERPSAIFASNDDMAAAAVSVAHRRGLDVPRDLSVVGFDDTAIATTLWPELTTVRQPIGDMGIQAVNLLLQQIRARRDGVAFKPADIVMPHVLIERQSSARYQTGMD
ncbi:MAG TPA: LacI family DNA-binding transcriptional regulator [Caulobacterales bacterium]|nr:LacI family DNA-binding transcriptional regulator [Caulobacterales bacterium]